MNPSVYSTALKSFVWRDMGHFGRFRVSGRDAASLLHHLTTNDIKRLRPGQSCDAALISNRARMLDWLTVVRDADAGGGFIVITSPNRREMFEPHARRFIGFRQDIAIEDVSGNSALWAVFGGVKPEIGAFRTALHYAPTARLPGGGWWIWGEIEELRAVQSELSTLECDPDTFNVLRVEAGLPVAGAELIEEVNPWEAGLDSSISLSKGCYNGQEVVARLHTYKKVKQRLCGLRLSAVLSLAPGVRAKLGAAGRDAGFVTSAVVSPRFGPIALGYARTGYQEAGQQIEVVTEHGEEIHAVVAPLPFGTPSLGGLPQNLESSVSLPINA